MPVSGYEEPGFKPHGWHSSDSIAGVPIKKRRLPFIVPQSPPPETQSSQAVEPVQTEKEHFNLKEASPKADDAREASGTSGTPRSYSQDEKGKSSADSNVDLVQSKVCLPGFVIGEPTRRVPLGSGAERSDKQETKVTDRPVSPEIPENSAPQLAQKEAVVLGLVEHTTVKEESGCNIKSELLNSTEKSKLPSMPKEPVISALAAQNNHGSCGDQQFTDPCSLNLTLVKADTDAKSKTTACESTVGGTFPPANRSLWDLNTTMDRWEDSMNEPSTSQRLHGPDGSDGAAACATVPVISSAVMVFREPERTGVHIGKVFLDNNECKSRTHGFTNLRDQQTISDEQLNLCLTPSGLHSRFSQKQSCMARKIDSVGVETTSKSFESSVPSGRKLNMSGSIIKSEPSDEVNKLDFRDANAISVRSESRVVKAEQVEDQSLEYLKSSMMSDTKLISHAKPEPVYKANQAAFKAIEEIQSQEEQATCTPGVPKIQDWETPASHVETFGTMGLSRPLGPHLSTVDIPKIAEVSCQPDLPYMKETPVNGDVALEPCGSYGGADSVMASESVGHDAKETEIGVAMIATSETRELGDGNPESFRSKLELQHREVADTESDEEKINISTGMLEDDSYDTGYESDGSHAMGVTSVEEKQRRVEDDFEDGEVREPLLHKGGVCKQKEQQDIGCDESEYIEAGIPGHLVSKSPGEDGGAKIGENVESKDDFCGGEFSSSLPYEKNDQDAGELATLQEPLGVEVPSTESDKKVTISATRSKSLNCSGGDDSSRGHEEDLTSNHTLCYSQVTTPGDGQSDIMSQQEDFKADPGENNHLVLPTAEPSTDGDETTKDANDRGIRRRIINLPRASSGSSSSSKPRPTPGRSLPSLAEKEIYTDVVFKGDRVQNQGNRDESYIDGSHKFEKERNQDQAVGNSGSDFLQGRGRVDNRLETVYGDWDHDHDFSSEHYNGPTALRLPRSKNAVATKLECSGFIVAPDVTGVGSGRGGRKPLNDDLPVFCRPRRRSPVGREGPGTHVVRRPTRDMSPNRCAGGLRHEEKFMRGMPEDILDPVFSHSQPQYEQVDSFMMGGRSFSPGHRRVPPRMARIRSKSPPRSRSPGPWVSPRRSPDGFDGHQPMSRRRSPPVYRMDRIRSPHQRPCFPNDMVGRRHGSPPYMPRLPNDIREMGSREHEHPRPFLSNRSPSGRVLPRNNRRFDMIDPRERTENDEYFGGPMRSSRFQELGSEGVDERRKCNERRGPARPFRPPYNSNHVENFRFQFEDGPRPNQLCPETDPEFHERGNFRGREFDRRLKFRPGNIHRRTRSIEEQEENYRNGGHGWNDAGFDDVARGKRRRF